MIPDESKSRIDEMLADLTPDERKYAMSCLNEKPSDDKEDEYEDEEGSDADDSMASKMPMSKGEDEEEMIPLDEEKMFDKE